MSTCAVPGGSSGFVIEGKTRSRRLLVLAICCFLLVVLVSTVRLSLIMNEPGDLDPSRWGLVDVRDNIYYPAKSFVSGRNPYDREKHVATYPVRLRFPPYSPLFLLIHSPFALLQHVPAQLTYYALTALLTLVVAYLTLRMCDCPPSAARVFGLATLVLLTRPGHHNLILGQTALVFVLAVYAALYFCRRSPWLAGIAVAAATMKLTIGLPLVLLLLSMRCRRGVAAGICISLAVTLVPTVVLLDSAGGPEALFETMVDTASVFEEDAPADPVRSPSRIDAVAFVSMMLGGPLSPPAQAAVFLGFMAVGCAAIVRIRRLDQGPGADAFCQAIVVLSILIATYQQLYSALLLLLPLTALAVGRWAPAGLSRSQSIRWVLMALLLVPMFNPLAASRVLKLIEATPWLWTLTASLNRVALIVAFAVYVASALKYNPPTKTPEPEVAG